MCESRGERGSRKGENNAAREGGGGGWWVTGGKLTGRHMT